MCCTHTLISDEVTAIIAQAWQAREDRNARRRMLYALNKANQRVEDDRYTPVFSTSGTITMSDLTLVQKERELVTA
jgi:hypothetical protein